MIASRNGVAACFGLALHVLAWPAFSQECPTASSASRGFVVERNRQTVEVIRVNDRIVRTVYRAQDGETWLEATEYEGLFDLERIDRGRRSVYRPISELAPLFPLNAAQEITAEFEFGDPPRTTKGKITLKVKRTDRVFLGPCDYSVLVIDRTSAWGEKSPAFVRTDYYAPDLKLVIAKEFKERNGAMTLNKFDTIYPTKR